jgi:hypothetical protein
MQATRGDFFVESSDLVRERSFVHVVSSRTLLVPVRIDRGLVPVGSVGSYRGGNSVKRSACCGNDASCVVLFPFHNSAIIDDDLATSTEEDAVSSVLSAEAETKSRV